MNISMILAIALIILVPKLPCTLWLGKTHEARWEKSKEISAIIVKESKEKNINPILTMAVMLKESKGKVTAVRNNRDFGPMQVRCPSTFTNTLGIKRCQSLMSYRKGLRAGTYILNYVKKRYGKNYRWNQYRRPWRINIWFRKNLALAKYGWVEHYNWGHVPKSMDKRGSGYAKRVLTNFKEIQIIYQRYLEEV